MSLSDEIRDLVAIEESLPIEYLSIDAIKMMAQLLDGEWHDIRPSLRETRIIYRLDSARLIDYHYYPPIEGERHQKMKIQLHPRVSRHFVKRG